MLSGLWERDSQRRKASLAAGLSGACTPCGPGDDPYRGAAHHPSSSHHQDHPSLLLATHTQQLPLLSLEPSKGWKTFPALSCRVPAHLEHSSKAEIMAWQGSPELLHNTALWHHQGMLNICTATREFSFKFQQSSLVTFGNRAEENKCWCPHWEQWQVLFHVSRAGQMLFLVLGKHQDRPKKSTNLQQPSYRTGFRHWAGKAEVLLSPSPMERNQLTVLNTRVGLLHDAKNILEKFPFSIKNYTSPEDELFWCRGTMWTSDGALK